MTDAFNSANLIELSQQAMVRRDTAQRAAMLQQSQNILVMIAQAERNQAPAHFFGPTQEDTPLLPGTIPPIGGYAPATKTWLTSVSGSVIPDSRHLPRTLASIQPGNRALHPPSNPEPGSPTKLAYDLSIEESNHVDLLPCDMLLFDLNFCISRARLAERLFGGDVNTMVGHCIFQIRQVLFDRIRDCPFSIDQYSTEAGALGEFARQLGFDSLEDSNWDLNLADAGNLGRAAIALQTALQRT